MNKKQSRNICNDIERIGRWLLEKCFNKILLVLFIVFAVLWYWYKWTLGNGILAYTFWAILLYTWKTWQLKDLTSAQLSYNIRPLVIFELEEDLRPLRKNVLQVVFKLRNIGEGIATKICIEEPIFIKDSKDKKIQIYPQYKEISLARKDERKVPFFVSEYANGDELKIMAKRFIEADTENNIIKISYEDINRKKYCTIMCKNSYGNGWLFLETKRVL